MKKKILAIALVVAMLAVAIVSASLAYFTDEDYATNTFTIGEVDIDLREDFGNDDDTDDDGVNGPDVTFYPGVAVNKDVWVANTSETGNDAYVRVHVAFPKELAPRKLNGTTYEYDITGTDGLALVTLANGDEGVDYDEYWEWTDIYSANIGEEGGEIVPCVVYVATYLKPLADQAETEIDAITAVTVNVKADTDIIAVDNGVGGTEDHLHLFMDLNKDGEWDEGELRVDTQGTNPFTIEVEVAAEGVQVDGLGNDAEAALDTAFGNPGEYNLTGAEESENAISWTLADPAFDPQPSYEAP